MRLRDLFCAVLVACTVVVSVGAAGEIQDAAFRGDLAGVRALVAKDPGLAVAADENGWTPLHAAADAGHTEIVRLLLEQEAVLDSRTKNGWTPLLVAACNGRTEVVGLLLARGARLDAEDSVYGRSALHWAAIQGQAPVVTLLLEKGAKADARDKANATPLDYARSYGRKDLEPLLERPGSRS